MLKFMQALVSSLGWTYLDVRSSLECSDVGKIKDSVNIPIVNASKKWDPEQQKKVVKKEDNPDFVKQVTSISLLHFLLCLPTTLCAHMLNTP